jgi:phosphoribosylglycinamide formyltransferase-1
VQTIAIFASGTGTNAQKIIQHFQSVPDVQIQFVVSNKANAGVLDIARANHIDTLVIDRHSFYDTEEVLQQLLDANVDWIILAGFLWLIPPALVQAYPQRIINIHPALLPKYGGKGMYGMNVHKAVKANQESTTGITIHYVNEHYDEGTIIFQAECPVFREDTPETIARKVQQLEHMHFPVIIHRLLQNQIK